MVHSRSLGLYSFFVCFGLIKRLAAVFECEFSFAFQVSIFGHGCYRRQWEEKEKRKNVWLLGEGPGQGDHYAHPQ